MRDVCDTINFDNGKRAEWEAKRLPYSALIELTARCNMNCVHCYLQEHHTEAELSFAKVIEILDILYDKGIIFITLTGGEIFTRKDFVSIYLYAKKKGFLVELFSNGELVTDEMIEIFKKYPPVMIDISIYGACEETYRKVTGKANAFEKVVSNCRKLQEAGIRISLRTPVLTLTANEVEKMKDIADDIGIPFAVSYEIITTIDRDNISQKYQISPVDALEYEIRDYFTDNYNKLDVAPPNTRDGSPFPIFSCKIARGALVIDYNGNIFPCMKFRHVGQPLTRNNFDEIWASYSKYYSLKTSISNKCNSCDAAFYCEVCPAEMDFLFGDMEHRDAVHCTIAHFRKKLYEGAYRSETDAIKALHALN